MVLKKALTVLTLLCQANPIFCEEKIEQLKDSAIFFSNKAEEKTRDSAKSDKTDLEKLMALAELKKDYNQLHALSKIKKEHYFNLDHLKEYQKWIAETVDYSKRKETCAIIVDKAQYKLDFYCHGALKWTFDIDLGFNPYDDKRKEGDGTTPEGKYEIRGIKPRATFYKAFDINYPNESDRKEFEEAKENEELLPKDKIGGGIQIHGHGGKGFDWTLGCVAVTNEEMDILFEYVRTGKIKRGTPVTIVKYGTRIKDYGAVGDPLSASEKE